MVERHEHMARADVSPVQCDLTTGTCDFEIFAPIVGCRDMAVGNRLSNLHLAKEDADVLVGEYHIRACGNRVEHGPVSLRFYLDCFKRRGLRTGLGLEERRAL